MVNVIENRSVVHCRFDGDARPGPGTTWRECMIDVESTDQVEGYPDLIGTDLPRQFTALVPDELFDRELGRSRRWRVEAELVAPNRLRVHDTPPPPRPT